MELPVKVLGSTGDEEPPSRRRFRRFFDRSAGAVPGVGWTFATCLSMRSARTFAPQWEQTTSGMEYTPRRRTRASVSPRLMILPIFSSSCQQNTAASNGFLNFLAVQRRAVYPTPDGELVGGLAGIP